jgi:methionyl-tRNA formyltransferase
MSTKPSILFFGSFQHYSTQILEAVFESDQFELLGVVTTPPKPAGRDKILTKTHVHTFAESHHLPFFTPEELTSETLKEICISLTPALATFDVDSSLLTPDIFLVAGYSKLLPPEWLKAPQIASINVHFSLLPKYRGAMPAEWAILAGEKESGVTLIEMSPKFDTGNMIAQASIPIEQPSLDPESSRGETRETLYTKLYNLGAKLTLEALPKYVEWRLDGQTHARPPQFPDDNTAEQAVSAIPRNEAWGSAPTTMYLPPIPQPAGDFLYAKLLSKEDTYIPWPILTSAMKGESFSDISKLPSPFQIVAKHTPRLILNTEYLILIERSVRSFYPWPGVWTKVNTPKGEKRLKILSSHLDGKKLALDQVQLEGKTPTQFDQIENQFV